MKRKHMLAMLLAATMAASMLSACGSKSESAGVNETASAGTATTETAEVTGEKVVTAMTSILLAPESADAVYGGEMDFRLYEMIYDPLVRFGYNGEIEPALAESWDISEDNKEYTFHLRQGVKFSDGTEFNADNVLWNYNRWVENECLGNFSAPLKSVEKVDDLTVKFVFDAPSSNILTELTFPRPFRMTCESALDADGVFQQGVGTAMWMVESYQSGQEVVLVPNPNYWGEKPQIDKVILKQVEDGDARVMALQSKDADLNFQDIPAENASIIESTDYLSSEEEASTMSFFLIQNYECAPLQDINVRKALNYATNNDAIVDSLLDGYGVASKGLFSDSVAYTTEENNKGYAYDLDKAAECLKAAGYEDTDGNGIVDKDGKDLVLKLVFQSEEYSTWKPLCEFLKSEYEKAGIGIDLAEQESSAYYDAIWTTRDYDLCIYRTYEDSWMPFGFMTSLFYQPEGGSAVLWYDEELNGMIDELKMTTDPDAYAELMNKAMTRMDEEAMTVSLYAPKRDYTYNNQKLANVVLAPTAYEGVDWAKLQVIQ